MTTIELQTEINANIERVFDISRDVDMHKLSAKGTNEKAIAGRMSGLCEEGDVITWQAKHFGIRQKLTVEITKVEKPFFFEDRMLKGAFKSMQHQHFFEVREGKTMMYDKFCYEVPFGLIGKLFDKLVLKDYMTQFLLTRNQILKEVAEK
jgi:ligand-binding SRPBCC domain-containing protein